MPNLKIDCLGVTPFPFEKVEGIYLGEDYTATPERLTHSLCLSHERMRAELEGMEVMLRDTEGELKRTQELADTLGEEVSRLKTSVGAGDTAISQLEQGVSALEEQAERMNAVLGKVRMEVGGNRVGGGVLDLDWNESRLPKSLMTEIDSVMTKEYRA